VKVYAALAEVKYRGPLFNRIQYPYILSSFAYNKALPLLDYKPDEVTLDSGAFTAWSVGKQVDIAAYKDWAFELLPSYPNLRCVNLDVIPAEKGRNSTKAERIDGMKRSVENADYLRAAGLRVMEVFHQDEPLEFLDLLLSRLPEGEVLCISPRNDVSLKAKAEWQQGLLKHIVANYGVANFPKTHGLAVTSKKLCLEFPYFSVDSSSYASPAMYGRVTDYDGKTISSKEFIGFDVRETKAHYKAMNFLLERMLDENLKLGEMAATIWSKRGISWK
jgi:hypothetical protein